MPTGPELGPGGGVVGVYADGSGGEALDKVGAGIAAIRTSAVSRASRQGQLVGARSLRRLELCTSRAGMEISLIRSVSVVAVDQLSPAAARVWSALRFPDSRRVGL